VTVAPSAGVGVACAISGSALARIGKAASRLGQITRNKRVLFIGMRASARTVALMAHSRFVDRFLGVIERSSLTRCLPITTGMLSKALLGAGANESDY
jgi:uncharacterized membrane protein